MEITEYRLVTNGSRYRIQEKEPGSETWEFVTEVWDCGMGGIRAISQW